MTEHMKASDYLAMLNGKSAPNPTRKRAETKDYVGEFLATLWPLNLPACEREFIFHPERDWRFDAAWPAYLIAVEYQGIFAGYGADASHGSVSGRMRDYRKWTEAQLFGWTVILIDAKSVEDGTAQDWMRRVFAERGEK